MKTAEAVKPPRAEIVQRDANMESRAITGSTVGTTRNATSGKRRFFMWTVYIIGFVIILALFAEGYSYYTTPYNERPHHEDYRSLRPAGSRGLIYGITGSSMMILMLVYTFRKRTRVFGQRIPMRHVLDFHIFLGVFGPLLIVLHTSLKVQGLVAIAFWSMVAVALSGYFGRYLYRQIPRNLEDRELGLNEISQYLDFLQNEMGGKQNSDDNAPKMIAEEVDAVHAIEARGTIGMLWRLLISDMLRPLTRYLLHRRLAAMTNLPTIEFNAIFDLAVQRAMLKRRLEVLSRVQRLFHYWHVIHKPFAIIMYIIMGVHIGVAIWTGYGWFR